MASRVYRHELTGLRFGKLVVLERTEKRIHGKVVWRCRCDCGKESEVLSTRLISGHTKSCGCYNSEHTVAQNTTHGKSKTRLYRIWDSMKTRCFNAKSRAYSYYGGKGITVCPEWKNDFSRFYSWAVTHGYRDDLTIDRINPSGNYCPQNCRWATWHEQRINQTRMGVKRHEV